MEGGHIELSEWQQYLGQLPGLDPLVQRLTGPGSAPVLMVGSALSLPEAGRRSGVPGVAGMIKQVRVQVRREALGIAEFEQRVNQAPGSAKYQVAFEFLKHRRGPKAVNDVVRAAVLRARKPRALKSRDDRKLEEDLGGWALSRGTRALGALLANFPDTFPGPVLTTNFDPLLWASVKLAGGNPRRTVLDSDGRLPFDTETEPGQQQIVYLHGYWRGRSDTRHTGIELTADRPQLEASLERLLEERLLAVVGYGGWEDAFMRVVDALLSDVGAKPDIVWALRDADPAALVDEHAELMDRFDRWRARGRFQFYAGVDAHELFERLLERASGTSGPAAGQAPPRTRATTSTGTSTGTAKRRSRRPARLPAPRDEVTVPVGPAAPRRTATIDRMDKVAGVLDDVVRQCQAPSGSRGGPGARRSGLAAVLGDLEGALRALSDVELERWSDTGQAAKVRTARQDAGKHLSKLRRHLAANRKGQAEGELRQLLEDVSKASKLVRRRRRT